MDVSAPAAATAPSIEGVHITSRRHGYACQYYEGYASQAMTETEIAFACGACEYFGWRDFKRDGDRFSVTVHID